MDVLDALTPVLRGRGMKRRTVAARAGMTEQRLSDTVHRRRRLTADELFALCRALEITPDTVPCQVSLAEEIKAPIRLHQVLGVVTYRVDGLIYSANLVAGHEVQKKPFWLYNTLVAAGLVLLVMFAVYYVNKRKQRRRRAAAARRRAARARADFTPYRR